MTQQTLRKQTDTTPQGPAAQRPILITGAAGFIARCVLPHFSAFERLRLLDCKTIGARDPAVCISGDICSLEEMVRACQGIDTVIHLAAEPSMGASFAELLQPNIVGAYNMFEAARIAGCRRVIYASSINTVLGYGADSSVHWQQAVNPVNLYGVSKCFGEALGRQYAHRGLSVLCVRIGIVKRPQDPPRPPGDEYEYGWISDRDLARLFELCVEVDGVDYAILHAQGAHARPRLNMRHTFDVLGFTPQDGSNPPG